MELNIALTIFGGLIGLIAVLIGILHKDMSKKIDKLDVDLKPLLEFIIRHGADITQLKEENEYIWKAIDEHDKRIHHLEHD